MANSVDSDQMLHVASDLVLHYLQRPVYLNSFDKYNI